MDLISVIIPVYNVEEYLDKCIQSVIAQTYTNLEIILVDDGSTDNSGIKCDEYARTDSRIVVIHKENGGLSSARNAGIEIAKGDYLGFVDSDDYIEQDMYELLYTNLKTENADMSMCGSYDCYENKEPKKLKHVYKVMQSEEAIREVLRGKLFTANAWNKLYKRNLFEKIRYPEGKTSEDAFVIVDLLMLCCRIVVDSKQKYYYYHRVGSITTNPSAVNSLFCVDAYKKNYELIRKNYPRSVKYAKSRLCWANFYCLDRLMVSYDEEEFTDREEKIIQFLRRNTLFVFLISTLHWKRKISSVALLFSKKLYATLLGLNDNQHKPNK